MLRSPMEISVCAINERFVLIHVTSPRRVFRLLLKAMVEVAWGKLDLETAACPPSAWQMPYGNQLNSSTANKGTLYDRTGTFRRCSEEAAH